MPGLNNLAQGNIAEFDRRLRALETAAPANSTAIGAGGLRVHSGGVISIENGGLQVIGSGTFIGTLYANGTISFTGQLTQSGPSNFTGDTTFNGPTHIRGATDITGNTSVTGDLTVTGPTKLNGKTDIGGNTSVTGNLTVTGPTKLNGKTDIGGNTSVDGTLDIKGKSTLQNDLDVRNGGKVKVGRMLLDPSRFDGGVVFDNGSYLAATANGAQFVDGSAGVTVSSNQADMGVIGGGAVIAHGAGVAVTGIPSTSSKPNVYIDANGQLKRSTAA